MSVSRTGPIADAVRRRRFPIVGRLFGGELSVTMMTELRGGSNAKAGRAFGWELRYPSWRAGFREGIG